MHERKTLMADLADAFIALPGGFGTFDELCEMATWDQLGIHVKPLVLVNVEGFFDGFLAQLDRARRRPASHAGAPRDALRWRRRVGDALRRFAPLAGAAAAPKWLSRSGRPSHDEAACRRCRTTRGARSAACSPTSTTR